MLAYARALLTSTPDGATRYLHADLRDTSAVLAESARTLDFARPIALMLLIILHLIPDSDDPHGLGPLRPFFREHSVSRVIWPLLPVCS